MIRNRKELATTKKRKILLELIEAGIQRVLPRTIMNSAVQFDRKRNYLTVNNNGFDLSLGRLFVLGGGKASGAMAEALEKIIGHQRITAGVVNCKSSSYNTKRIRIIKAGHPLPNKAGISGVRAMYALRDKYSITENDLILCLISGGGSALMSYPVENVTLEDEQRITDLLLKSSADIHEINVVRKHMSRIKGGNLARHFSPARIISLILSDVIGNNLDIIASGPTSPDTSTFMDALSILKKYRLYSKTPKSIRNHLRKGCEGRIGETAKELPNAQNFIIGDNRLALEAMNNRALELDQKPYIITSNQIGDTTEMARMRAQEFLENKYPEHNIFLIGGETTQRIPKNPGKGGRNQHYAAVSLTVLKDYDREWAMCAVGTDGSDFIKDVAGAMVDNQSAERAKKLDVEDHIKRHDCYNLFRKMGSSLIMTGNTGTNVCDIMVYIKDFK